MIAVEKRQGYVQQHKVRRKGCKLAHNIAQIVRAAHLKSPGLGLPLYALSYAGVVLDDKDTVHLFFLEYLFGKLGRILDAAAARTEHDAGVAPL